MSVLDKAYRDQVSRSYRTRMDEVDELVVAVLLEAYQELTNKRPSDRFREKIEEAVIYDQ